MTANKIANGEYIDLTYGIIMPFAHNEGSHIDQEYLREYTGIL